MAGNMFLKIDGIDSESEDADHKNWIDVLSWSWGMSQSANAHMGGGGTRATADVQDVSIAHFIDRSSPILMGACLEGKHIPKATLEMTKAGADGKALPYLKVNFHDLVISNVSTGGSQGEDVSVENFSMNFAKVDFEYSQQDAKGGAGAKPKMEWDVKTGKGSFG